MGANKKNHKFLHLLLLVAYLIFLFYFLFFAESMGRYGSGNYRYNLTLFREIRRFLSVWRDPKYALAVLLNLVGNVIAFVPFGYFEAALLHPKNRWYLALALSFELSLCVELLQLWTRLGCFDVDDLLLNTFGGLCGYWLYLIVGVIRKAHRKRRAK